MLVVGLFDHLAEMLLSSIQLSNPLHIILSYFLISLLQNLSYFGVLAIEDGLLKSNYALVDGFDRFVW